MIFLPTLKLKRLKDNYIYLASHDFSKYTLFSSLCWSIGMGLISKPCDMPRWILGFLRARK